MHSLIRFVIFAGLLAALFQGQALAEDIWRLRYLVLSAEQGKISVSGNESSETPKTEGFSGHLVFGSGIGFGFTTMTTEGKIGNDALTLQSDNIDISYTFGTDWNLTLGYGRGMTGKGNIDGSKNYVTSKVRGDALFILLGIPFIGGELIGGFRKNELEFGPFQTSVNGIETKLENNVINHSEHLMLGYGLHF